MYKAKHVKYSDNFYENNEMSSYDNLRKFINTNYRDSELMDYNEYLRDY